MKFLIPAIAASVAFVALPVAAGETLGVQVPAVIDPAAPIPVAVKNECGVDLLLGNHALSALGDSGFVTQASPNPEPTADLKVVQLTILSVQGLGGGNWSGAKSMSVRADLKQGASTLHSKVFSRSSGGGAWGGFKGTCGILERVATALGKDIAKWAARPPAASTGQPNDPPTAASEPAVASEKDETQEPLQRP